MNGVTSKGGPGVVGGETFTELAGLWKTVEAPGVPQQEWSRQMGTGGLLLFRLYPVWVENVWESSI